MAQKVPVLIRVVDKIIRESGGVEKVTEDVRLRIIDSLAGSRITSALFRIQQDEQ
jgi:hypothetical protein